jgi:hypothetical protein
LSLKSRCRRIEAGVSQIGTADGESKGETGLGLGLGGKCITYPL